MTGEAGRGWLTTVGRALVLLLLVALGARVVWWLLAPLIPGLAALGVLVVVYLVLVGGARRL